MEPAKQLIINLCIKLELGNKLYDKIHMGILALIHILRARDFFMTMSFLHNRLRLFKICDALGKGFKKS